MKRFYAPETVPGHVRVLAQNTPMPLDNGSGLGPFPLAYQTYGSLNKERSNAILMMHALTGDQVVAGKHPVTGKPGWWNRMVGPGKIIDTDRYFVICINVLGGCMGSAGPCAVNPATGKMWSGTFPVITIGDMVRAQALLLDALDIEDVFCVIGGSMGGMLALQWLRDYPHRTFAAAAIATASRHSPQQIAFHSIGRKAITADPAWQGGFYHETDSAPINGLMVARMLAHHTYRSPEEFSQRFGRKLQNGDKRRFDLDIEYQVESYLSYHGGRFTERFDPASYMLITKAMDYFDLAPDGPLEDCFSGIKAPVFLASYSTDWLYPPSQSAETERAMTIAGLSVQHQSYDTLNGHDSFLLEIPQFDADFSRFLHECADRRGL